MQDSELLRQYLQQGSEAAFAELVQRYLGLVYSTARRQLGDSHLAEEVSQTVFCLLARKAGSLTGAATLAGWLHRAACFSAARALRTELRRRRREQQAAAMTSPDPSPDLPWDQLTPLLDQALNELAEKDRLALLLRFFQSKPMRQVGEALGVSEAAAKMRIGRSVERLRQFFARRGVACSAVGLTALLTERAVEAAPSALASDVITRALSGAAVGGVTGLSLFQTLLLMSASQGKTMILAGVAALLLLTGGWLTYSTVYRSAGHKLPTQPARSTVASLRANQLTPLARRAVALPMDAELADAIANLRAALHSTNNSYSPGPEVVDAVERFGARKRVAFEILKEEAQAHDESRHSADDAELPPRRAVAAMGFLSKSVPEAAAFLWDTFNAAPSTQSDSMAFVALGALDHLGFEPRDITSLAQKVLAAPRPVPVQASDPSDDPPEPQPEPVPEDAFVKSEVAGWLAATIKQQPAATAPFVAEVSELLSASDEGTRFWVACALLQSQGSQNPALLDIIASGLKSGDRERLAWVSQMLKDFGAAGQPLAPTLLEAGQATTNQPASDWALLAAGKLDPALRTQAPAVDQVLTKEESDQALLDRVNSGTYTGNDLVAALAEPGSVNMAASLLGDMGPAATNALPALFACLTNQSRSEGQEVLRAMHKIDPQAALTPEDAFSVLTTLMQGLNGEPNPQGNKTFQVLENEHWLSLGWCTRAGFPDFAHRLAATDTGAYNALVSAVLEKAPHWRALLPTKPGAMPSSPGK